MELLAAYIYNTSPIKMTNINGIKTIENMKRNHWFEDSRKPTGFKIMLKRYNIEDTWYRIVIRFRVKEDSFELDTPVPFMVFLTERQEVMGSAYVVSVCFVDKKAWHGKTVGSTVGYLEQGVPAALVDAIVEDLKECVVYIQN